MLLSVYFTLYCFILFFLRVLNSVKEIILPNAFEIKVFKIAHKPLSYYNHFIDQSELVEFKL